MHRPRGLNHVLHQLVRNIHNYKVMSRIPLHALIVSLEITLQYQWRPDTERLDLLSWMTSATRPSRVCIGLREF
jgi:hypothetical protein